MSGWWRARAAWPGVWVASGSRCAALAAGLACALFSALSPAASLDAGLGVAAPAIADASTASERGAPEARKPSVKQGVVTVVNLSSGISENVAQGLFSSGPGVGFSQLVLALEKLEQQPRTAGLLLRLGPGLSLAHAEELSALLQRLKLGRRIVCHAHQYSNAGLWLSRGCDEVWLSPAGSVEAVGLATQAVYLGGFLQRLGVQAQFLHMGRYKSAAEALTRSGPSEAARESLSGVLASVRETWQAGLSRGRRGAEVMVASESGPWTPQGALARGLVDRVGYFDQARERSLELSGADSAELLEAQLESSAGSQTVARALRALAGLSGASLPAPVVVVPLSGEITLGSGGGWGEAGIAAAQWLPVLRRLRKDDAVKAVVLRINSPGGSALASDLLWHELMLLREAKTVVASLGDVAASGGYYLASAAHEVVSDRTTWLGSIGVVGGKIVVAGALAKLGVQATTFGANPEPGANTRAAYLSPLTAWDEATRERVQQQLRSVYDLFVARVAEGRSMPKGSVRSVAEGRIWSGTQGLERHLVDRQGGLLDAVALARTRAKLPPGSAVQVEQGPDPLLLALGLDQPAAYGWLSRGLQRWAKLPLAASLGQGPLDARVRRLLASSGLGAGRLLEPSRAALSAALVPLLDGEVALAVMPFALLQP